MALSDMFFSKFDLYSDTYASKDKRGYVSRTVLLKQSNVPAYVTYLKGREQKVFGGTNLKATHWLYCNPIDGLKSTDKVKINGSFYDILFIYNAKKPGQQNHFELYLLGIQNPQNYVIQFGTTWGEEHPTLTLPEQWNWYLKGTNTPATITGIWGEMEITSLQQVVSPVKDLDIGNKNIKLTYDDYSTCSHNSGQKIWWRGSDTIFDHADNEVIGPVWQLYGGEFATGFRYIQTMCSIY